MNSSNGFKLQTVSRLSFLKDWCRFLIESYDSLGVHFVFPTDFWWPVSFRFNFDLFFAELHLKYSHLFPILCEGMERKFLMWMPTMEPYNIKPSTLKEVVRRILIIISCRWFFPQPNRQTTFITINWPKIIWYQMVRQLKLNSYSWKIKVQFDFGA